MKKSILLVLLLSTGAVNAEPGEVARQLMAQPASMFDIGMLRLQNTLDWFDDRVGLTWSMDGARGRARAELHAYYDDDIDKIRVTMDFRGRGLNDEEMDFVCRFGIVQLGHVLRKTARVMFLPIVAGGTDRIDGLGRAATEMIEIRCKVEDLDVDGRELTFRTNLSDYQELGLDEWNNWEYGSRE